MNLVFPQLPCFELTIPNQGKTLNCGYWVLYYCFLLIQFELPLQYLSDVLFMTTSRFDSFKSIVKGLCDEIFKKGCEMVRLSVINKD